MNPGEILDNRYEIVARLGAGGMGEVYKAVHTHLGAPRVIKVVHPQISGNVDAADRFLREAKAATKVHHPNVATLHDFSTLSSGAHYMVWEFIDGENLAQKLRSRGPLPPREAVRLIVQALHGLEAVHRAGIIHRDISPENLMIAREDETVKIIDLGVAKVDDSDVSQTRTGIFVGKLRYAAPEQLGFIPEGEKIDARADIYSMAMVLVELLTGRPPYEAKSPHEYFILHASQAPLKTVELPVELPGSAALQAVLQKALARDRNHRYTTAREFALALEDVERALPQPQDTATVMTPLAGDATVQLARNTAEAMRRSSADTLHRSTQVTGAGQATAASSAAPTLLTPLPQGAPAQQAPQAQAFPPQQPKQGSFLPLVIIAIAVMLLGGAVVGAYMLWPFGRKAEPAVTETTATQPASTTVAQPKAAEASLTVTSGTGDPATATVPPPVIVETTQTTAPPPVVVPPTTTTAPPRPVKEVVVEKPPVTTPSESEDEAPAPRPRNDSEYGVFSAATYVDGGDDDSNERAIIQLRRHLRGTQAVSLRAGGMTAELTRALREEFPAIRFEAEADVVIRFEGTFERRARALKRRAAQATVEKNGKVIFRYQLPDEVYRVGQTPAEAFASVLANALNEE